MVSCVKCGAQREPTVVGKPHQPMFDVIQHRCMFNYVGRIGVVVLMFDLLHRAIAAARQISLLTW